MICVSLQNPGEKVKMDFKEYQDQAVRSKQFIKDIDNIAIPLLDLVGEIGSLSSEYKKLVRDGTSCEIFPERISEELGDILQCISVFASNLGLDLADIAEKNLEKCRDRWGIDQEQDTPRSFLDFDIDFPEQEKLPKRFEVEIIEKVRGRESKTQTFFNGIQIGDDLTDNSYTDDGYRFHDIFHFSYAAILGWSPVVRKMLGCKRKSQFKVDEIEDGGRAVAVEEGISALVFRYAQDHNFLEGITEIDYELLRMVRNLTSGLEVSKRSLKDWEKAILSGYEVWRKVSQNSGGLISVNLNSRSISYATPRKKFEYTRTVSSPVENLAFLYSSKKCG